MRHRRLITNKNSLINKRTNIIRNGLYRLNGVYEICLIRLHGIYKSTRTYARLASGLSRYQYNDIQNGNTLRTRNDNGNRRPLPARQTTTIRNRRMKRRRHVTRAIKRIMISTRHIYRHVRRTGTHIKGDRTYRVFNMNRRNTNNFVLAINGNPKRILRSHLRNPMNVLIHRQINIFKGHHLSNINRHIRTNNYNRLKQRKKRRINIIRHGTSRTIKIRRNRFTITSEINSSMRKNTLTTNANNNIRHRSKRTKLKKLILTLMLLRNATTNRRSTNYLDNVSNTTTTRDRRRLRLRNANYNGTIIRRLCNKIKLRVMMRNMLRANVKRCLASPNDNAKVVRGTIHRRRDATSTRLLGLQSRGASNALTGGTNLSNISTFYRIFALHLLYLATSSLRQIPGKAKQKKVSRVRLARYFRNRTDTSNGNGNISTDQGVLFSPYLHARRLANVNLVRRLSNSTIKIQTSTQAINTNNRYALSPRANLTNLNLNRTNTNSLRVHRLRTTNTRETITTNYTITRNVSVKRANNGINAGRRDTVKYRLYPNANRRTNIKNGTSNCRTGIAKMNTTINLCLLRRNATQRKTRLLARVRLRTLHFRLLLSRLTRLEIGLKRGLLLFFGSARVTTRLRRKLYSLRANPTTTRSRSIPRVKNTSRLLRRSRVFRNLRNLRTRTIATKRLQRAIKEANDRRRLIMIIFGRTSNNGVACHRLTNNYISTTRLVTRVYNSTLHIRLDLLNLGNLIRTIRVLTRMVKRTTNTTKMRTTFFMSNSLHSTLNNNGSNNNQGPNNGTTSSGGFRYLVLAVPPKKDPSLQRGLRNIACSK